MGPQSLCKPRFASEKLVPGVAPKCSSIPGHAGHPNTEDPHLRKANTAPSGNAALKHCIKNKLIQNYVFIMEKPIKDRRV